MDLVHIAIKAGSVFQVATYLIVCNHFVLVLRADDFIMDHPCVPILVFKLVKLLSEFSDQLVLLATFNFYRFSLFGYLGALTRRDIERLYLEIKFNY